MADNSTPLRLTVDEIERDQYNNLIAILVSDAGDHVHVPLTLLPDGTRVGDVLRVDLTLEPDERDRRRQTIAELQRKLFGQG